MNWKERAAKVSWNIKPFIGGAYLPSAAADAFESINPANEAPLASVPVGDARDVDRAVASARRRYEDGCWAQAPPGQRAMVLAKLADLVVAHKEELALLDALEMGKPIKAALFDAEHFTAHYLRSWASLPTNCSGLLHRSSQAARLLISPSPGASSQRSPPGIFHPSTQRSNLVPD